MRLDLDAARRALLAERDTIRRQLAAVTSDFDDVVAAASDVATDDEHDPEGSMIAYERARTAALAEQARTHLADIERALSRLDGGDYARCERCGGDIGSARLQARPTARRCIDCATRR